MSYDEDNFHPAFVWAVNQMMAECPGSSVGSGFRTVDEQSRLLGKRSQGISVADPGSSRHNGTQNFNGLGGAYGGAVDMRGDYDCLARAGAKYGLHQGVDGEPWHFEFTDEAWAAINEGTYQYGATAAQTEPEDSLAGIRSIIFGQGGPENPVDVPQRVSQAFAPEKAAEGAPEAAEFVPEASAGFTSDGSSLSAVDVARYYAQAGFTGDALVTMVAISKGESGWNPGAKGDTSITTGTWGPSIGLSQIRSLNAQAGTGGWRDPTMLADPAFNARAAYAISNGGTNFGPWTVYSKGIYQQHLEEAKQAVAALGAGAVGPSGPPAASVSPEDDDLGIDTNVDLMDPAGLSAEIAEMLLAQRKGSPQERVEDVAAENEEEAMSKKGAFSL